jgi:hypothetical protein
VRRVRHDTCDPREIWRRRFALVVGGVDGGGGAGAKPFSKYGRPPEYRDGRDRPRNAHGWRAGSKQTNADCQRPSSRARPIPIFREPRAPTTPGKRGSARADRSPPEVRFHRGRAHTRAHAPHAQRRREPSDRPSSSSSSLSAARLVIYDYRWSPAPGPGRASGRIIGGERER